MDMMRTHCTINTSLYQSDLRNSTHMLNIQFLEYFSHFRGVHRSVLFGFQFELSPTSVIEIKLDALAIASFHSYNSKNRSKKENHFAYSPRNSAVLTKKNNKNKNKK